MNVLYLVSEFIHSYTAHYLNALTKLNDESFVLYTYADRPEALMLLDAHGRRLSVSSLGFDEKSWESPKLEHSKNIKAWTQNRILHVLKRGSIDVIHSLMFMENDFLTLWTKEVLEQKGLKIPLVHEVRDNIGQLAGSDEKYRGTSQEKVYWDRMAVERRAVSESDGQIFVSQGTKDYHFHRYGFDSSRHLIVPHADGAALTLRKPVSKLSSRDGRIHVVLGGSTSADPNSGRFMGQIVEKFVENNPRCVLHSYFVTNKPADFDFYRALEQRLERRYRNKRYFCHKPLPHGPAWIQELGRYDFCLVLYELWCRDNARERNECHVPVRAATALALCGVPFLATAHSQGLADWVDRDGVGIFFENWSDLQSKLSDAALVRRVCQKAWRTKSRYSHESFAKNVRDFYKTLIQKSKRG